MVQQRLQLSSDALRLARLELGIFFEQAYNVEGGKRRKTDELHFACAGNGVGDFVVQEAREKIWPLLRAAHRKKAAFLQLLCEQTDEELKDLAIAIAKGVIALDHHHPAQARAVHLDRVGHGVEAKHVVITRKRACRAGDLLV